MSSCLVAQQLKQLACWLQVSVSKCELSDLIEDADRFCGGRAGISAEMASSSKHCETESSSKAGGVRGAAGGKNSRRQRRRAGESHPDSAVRVLVDHRQGAGGFTRDQCIQLQGQLRDYLQLAAQQYAVCCCDGATRAQRPEAIQTLYNGLAEMYRVWEVRTRT